MYIGVIHYMVVGCGSGLKLHNVDLNPVFSFQSIDPPFKAGIIRSNHFAIDRENNVYIIERENHRVLKYDANGVLLRQIGSIGQGTNDLFYPVGVSIRDDLLVVLNQEGRQIKIFDLSGKSKHTVEFPGSYNATSICTCENGIFVDVKIYHGSLFKDALLINHISFYGEQLRSFGAIIPTSNFDGYANFNEINIAEGNTGIVGAFKNWPVLCGYDDRGNALFRRDLHSLRIPEIIKIRSRAEREKLDSPENIISERGIRGIRYNSGIILSSDRSSFLYAIAGTPVLLVFDLRGKLIGKGHLEHGEHPIMPHALIRTQEGRAILLGSTIEKAYFLYELSISDD